MNSSHFLTSAAASLWVKSDASNFLWQTEETHRKSEKINLVLFHQFLQTHLKQKGAVDFNVQQIWSQESNILFETWRTQPCYTTVTSSYLNMLRHDYSKHVWIIWSLLSNSFKCHKKPGNIHIIQNYVIICSVLSISNPICSDLDNF